MHGGRALITPAKKKEAVGKGEGGIWLFSDLYSPLLHSLALKLPYSNSVFLSLTQLWPLRFSSLSQSCYFYLFSIYYTHYFFFFPPMHQFAYLQTKSFKMFSFLPPPQLSMSSLNPRETWLKGPHDIRESIALPQGSAFCLVLCQCCLCYLQLLPFHFHMLTGVSYTLEVATTFEGMLFLFPFTF